MRLTFSSGRGVSGVILCMNRFSSFKTLAGDLKKLCEKKKKPQEGQNAENTTGRSASR